MGRREWYKKTTMLLVLLLITITITKVQEVIAALECNGTSSSIGGCLPDVDEFLMESETSTRILAGNARPTQKLTFQATGSRPQICNEKIYGNCINNRNVKATRCNYGTRCNREISKGIN
ncbi:uncharacterized protein LOC129872760 [Solanum dulcamara]|uniref:uncharacterized protein LOC129872760 n=1 Tax=Solanum dulcamara TaxID=45834 RepID=UPI0024855472|nr:uncharacterized protein LOC129872760 [Solanum dulcamara]